VNCVVNCADFEVQNSSINKFSIVPKFREKKKICNSSILTKIGYMFGLIRPSSVQPVTKIHK
jgi:hypothetical protein